MCSLYLSISLSFVLSLSLFLLSPQTPNPSSKDSGRQRVAQNSELRTQNSELRTQPEDKCRVHEPSHKQPVAPAATVQHTIKEQTDRQTDSQTQKSEREKETKGETQERRARQHGDSMERVQNMTYMIT